jgi:pyruvate/2-oxoglutarate dehydrogenase complex dihydrolipoamide acyltransferase (E2) component
MTTVATELKSSTATGYSVKTVADRIIGMDIDAQGNGERAAWKQYLGYSHLAIAKGVSKKNMVAAVFGTGAKASKNFDNMWSLAEKSHHNPLLLGNRDWADIRVMGIDDALSAVLLLVNSHMSVLEVGGKNAYGPVCGMSLDAIAAAKAAAEAEAKAELDAKAEADAAEAAAKEEAEASAQELAAMKEEPVSPPVAAMRAMQNATEAEIMDVIGQLSGKLAIDSLRELTKLFGDVVAAHDAAEDAKLGQAKAEEIKPRKKAA